MSAWIYCDNCDAGLPGPWDLETEALLIMVLEKDYEYTCPYCSNTVDYPNTNLIEEIADRIDNPKNK